MPRDLKTASQVLDAKAATGHSTVVNVTDFRHIIVCVSAAVNSSLTFKFKGSALKEGTSDITATQTVTNLWDYVAAYDLQDPSAIIPGDTGVALDNTTVVVNTRQYIINTDYLSQFAIEVSSYTDGSLTAWIAASSN